MPNPCFKAHLFVTEDHAECLHWATAEGSWAEFRGFVLQGLRSSTVLWWHSHATWPCMGCLEREVCIWKSLLTMRKDAGSFCSEPLRRLIGHSWPVGKIDLSIFIYICLYLSICVYIYLRGRRSSPNWGVTNLAPKSMMFIPEERGWCWEFVSFSPLRLQNDRRPLVKWHFPCHKATTLMTCQLLFSQHLS